MISNYFAKHVCLIIIVGGPAVQRQLWTLDSECRDGACLQPPNGGPDMQ